VAREETWNVLDDNNSGAALLKEFSKLIKASRFFPFKPSSRAHSRQRDVLTRESSGPDVRKRDVCRLDVSNVCEPWSPRPVLFEDFCAILVDLALERDREPRFLEAKVKSSDTREK
jgi:hypothetical protein